MLWYIREILSRSKFVWWRNKTVFNGMESNRGNWSLKPLSDKALDIGGQKKNRVSGNFVEAPK